ncbi:hypothetical protein VN24_15265 [Paenibacillus beijingensis]|uniref:Uncharacterized protein n=1 Tax=Paenibacillus beijingensis TaxID=1126833 RepID=A0A0D5NK05_9BACL|nr:hypothetical protein VN24_15265 [Paenibacillus beijingensis]
MYHPGAHPLQRSDSLLCTNRSRPIYGSGFFALPQPLFQSCESLTAEPTARLWKPITLSMQSDTSRKNSGAG